MLGDSNPERSRHHSFVMIASDLGVLEESNGNTLSRIVAAAEELEHLVSSVTRTGALKSVLAQGLEKTRDQMGLVSAGVFGGDASMEHNTKVTSCVLTI